MNRQERIAGLVHMLEKALWEAKELALDEKHMIDDVVLLQSQVVGRCIGEVDKCFDELWHEDMRPIHRKKAGL
jgi:hypothetical protein